MGLRRYKAKRDFSRTAEPEGGRPAPHSGLLFVVQKHDATRLHYDFRLEMEGVLKSWAVPKGFPWKKGDRRLAVQVEDHPYDYKDFEGIIPEGNYGAGTVMLWDTGTYRVGGDHPLKAWREGKLHLFLSGKKLNDEWTLVRIKNTENTDKPQWLLLKSGSDVKPLSAGEDDRSAASGRSMEEIANSADREWQSDRPKQKDTRTRLEKYKGTKTPSKPAARSKVRKAAATETQVFRELAGLPDSPARFEEPMKALLTRTLPKGSEWLYEIKFDGIRTLAVKNGASVTLFSRAGNDLTSKYSSIAQSVAALPVKTAVLDGEIAALDEKGRSSFQLLQCYHMGTERPPLLYYAFDLLQQEGKDLRTLALEKRKQALETLLKQAPENLRYSPALNGDADRIVSEMQGKGLEGLIAKKKGSTYETGRRSGQWLKFKWAAEQEFVIGGYTDPKGARDHFGALLVGYYDKGKLQFAGKVGTGFSEATLKDLFKRFSRMKVDECPFVNLPERRSGMRGGGITPSKMKLCTWVRPQLVAQVRFAEWTRDDRLRQPAFLGLREDKPAKEVVRES